MLIALADYDIAANRFLCAQDTVPTAQIVRYSRTRNDFTERLTNRTPGLVSQVRLSARPSVRAFDGRMWRTADNVTVPPVVEWIAFYNCMVDSQLRLPVSEINPQALRTFRFVSCSLA
jgi:hypothetical protein